MKFHNNEDMVTARHRTSYYIEPNCLKKPKNWKKTCLVSSGRKMGPTCDFCQPVVIVTLCTKSKKKNNIFSHEKSPFSVLDSFNFT